jgi:hypothetical protein
MTTESWNSLLLDNGGKQVPAEMYRYATVEEPVSKQRIGKHTTIGVCLETVFAIWSIAKWLY